MSVLNFARAVLLAAGLGPALAAHANPLPLTGRIPDEISVRGMLVCEAPCASPVLEDAVTGRRFHLLNADRAARTFRAGKRRVEVAGSLSRSDRIWLTRIKTL